MVLFRCGLSASLGVLATAAAAAAVYTTRGMLTEALIALFLAISLDPAVRMLMRWRELGGGAVGFTRRTFSTLASAVLVAVLTVYFLADLPRLQRGAADGRGDA
jgi:predicted PurR-regulated permease PerM